MFLKKGKYCPKNGLLSTFFSMRSVASPGNAAEAMLQICLYFGGDKSGMKNIQQVSALAGTA
ncbi:MAG: hypothetical protein B6245_13275 [Desulfobacteraceae bacterium 4572_88]|nr:MAG: hypothetical protein B6245_13275 [Desulfobacteraceae bacterium 4572_88]